jgi:hypothetical protein
LRQLKQTLIDKQNKIIQLNKNIAELGAKAGTETPARATGARRAVTDSAQPGAC